MKVRILVILLLSLGACDSGDDASDAGQGDASSVQGADDAGRSSASADTSATGQGVDDATQGGGVDGAAGDDTSGGPVEDAVEEPIEEPCPPADGLRPMRRSEHAGIFDPIGDQLVFFGGSLGVPVECSFPTSTFENETWLFDLRCQLWRMIPGGPPTGRTRHAAVYDSTEHRMLIFGGRFRAGASGDYSLFSDVWAFDLDTESWSEVPTTSGPSARINAGVVYDPSGHRMIVFGGNASASGMGYIPLNDTWVLDILSGTWSELATSGAPSPRLFQSALWDVTRQRMIIHGGANEGAFFDNAQYFDEVYALDVDSGAWARLDDPMNQRPDGRFWGGLVHDTMHDGYLLFGGHDDASLGNRNDLWSFDPDLATWTQIEQGDTYNKPANGFCSFPPDFTNVAMDVPERRNAHIWVAGESTVWLSGGKTDCGVVDDVVALDLESLTWTEVDTATVGVSCLRKGGLTCNDLCF
jgi:hypothetical protein